MHLYLIRHGQSHVNLEDWKHGNRDEGLTDLGQQQAAALARWLPTELPKLDAFYSSTLRRARETAVILAGAYEDCPIHYDDCIREIGYNRLDHTPWPNDALPRDYAEYWASERPFSSVVPEAESGETWMHFRTRVGSFVEEIVVRHRDEVVVAVCHGGVVEAIFDHIFNIGPWHHCEVWDYNTGITYFEYVDHPRREPWRLHYHNRIDHLREEE